MELCIYCHEQFDASHLAAYMDRACESCHENNLALDWAKMGEDGCSPSRQLLDSADQEDLRQMREAGYPQTAGVIERLVDERLFESARLTAWDASLTLAGATKPAARLYESLCKIEGLID